MVYRNGLPRVAGGPTDGFIRDNYLIDVVRNGGRARSSTRISPTTRTDPRARTALVPMGRATLVEDVVIPDRDPAPVDQSTGHYKCGDAAGRPAARTTWPIVVTMRLSS